MATHPRAILFITEQISVQAVEIFRGAAAAGAAAGYRVVWLKSDGFALKDWSPSRLKGVILSCGLLPARRIFEELRGKVPMATTTGAVLDLPIPAVLGDPSQIAASIVDHLHGEGVRKFIYMGYLENPGHRWRAEALHAEVSKRLKDFSFSFFNVRSRGTILGLTGADRKALVTLLRREGYPVAIVGFDDRIASLAMDCVVTAGLRIPGEVLVLGVNNNFILSNLMVPLTSVHLDFEELGREAARVVLAARSGRTESAPQRILIPGELIIRDSSQLVLASEPKLMAVVAYIRENYHQPIGISDLARRAGMSRTKFTTCFEEIFGKPPIQYLLAYRLERAKELLAETSLTIGEIGARVGFLDQNYFARLFRMRMHVSPTEFRRRRQIARELLSDAGVSAFPDFTSDQVTTNA